MAAAACSSEDVCTGEGSDRVKKENARRFAVRFFICLIDETKENIEERK